MISLYSGVKKACFHSAGSDPHFIERLNNINNGLHNPYQPFFMINACTLSGPIALLVFSLDNFCSRSSLVIETELIWSCDLVEKSGMLLVFSWMYVLVKNELICTSAVSTSFVVLVTSGLM